MSTIHAFQRRRFFTCATCWCSEPDHKVCRYNGQVIRWNPCLFGCGDYCAGEAVPMQTTLEGWR